MYNALTIAHYFVSKSINSNVKITVHQAEFMVLFAHGWHLAIDGRPLIHDQAKAWRHGPVIEVVHKFYSKQKDIAAILNIEMMEQIKDRDRDFLDGLWRYYIDLSEIQMLDLCTDYGTPWYMVHGKSSGALLIDDKRIKQHYRLLHISHPEFADIDDPFSTLGLEGRIGA